MIQAVWSWISSNWPLLLAILLGPIGLAVAVIATYWDDIWDGVKAVWNWLDDTWSDVYGYITAPISSAASWISGALDTVAGYFTSAVGAISSTWSAVYGWITGPISSAISWVSSNVSSIAGFFSGVANAIGNALSGVEDAITGPFKAAWSWIQSNIISPLKSAWNTVANAINGVSISFTIPSNAITDFLHVSGQGFSWSPPFHIPTLAQGGLITHTGLIYAHAGEAISPIPGRAGLGRSGPVVEIQHAHFSEKIDVETFGRRLAWTVKTAGV